MQIMDLLGYEPSPWNKINIHVGGVGRLAFRVLARSHLHIIYKCVGAHHS